MNLSTFPGFANEMVLHPDKIELTAPLTFLFVLKQRINQQLQGIIRRLEDKTKETN